MMCKDIVRGGKLDFGVEWENLCNQPIFSPMCPVSLMVSCDTPEFFKARLEGQHAQN